MNKLQDRRLVVSSNSSATVPVHNLHLLLANQTKRGSECVTYHWPQEVVPALLEPLQRILLVACALDNAGNPAGADVLQDGMHLILRGRVLGDVELEGVAARGGGLGGVVAGLVLCRSGLGAGGGLL